MFYLSFPVSDVDLGLPVGLLALNFAAFDAIHILSALLGVMSLIRITLPLDLL